MTAATSPFLKTLSISNACSTSSLHILSIFNPKSLSFSISSQPSKLPLSVSLSSTQIFSFSLQKPTLSSRLISRWGAQDLGVGDGEGEVSDVGAEDDGEGVPVSPEDVRLYVGNLPSEVDSEKLAQLFEGAGVVEIAEVMYYRDTGKSRRIGFVSMSTVEEAETAVEMFNNYELNGRTLTVNKAAPRGSRPRRGSRHLFRMYVGNLPWDVDGARLRQVFAEYGQVRHACVILERETGGSRGFGFVTMASEAQMNNAISALDGQPLDGRELKVAVAQLPNEDQDVAFVGDKSAG